MYMSWRETVFFALMAFVPQKIHFHIDLIKDSFSCLTIPTDAQSCFVAPNFFCNIMYQSIPPSGKHDLIYVQQDYLNGGPAGDPINDRTIT